MESGDYNESGKKIAAVFAQLANPQIREELEFQHTINGAKNREYIKDLREHGGMRRSRFGN